MSAQPLEESPPPWQPDPIRQRLANHTLEDLLNLPPDAPRVELVDGVIHVVPSPTVGHQDLSFLVCAWLRAHAPAGYRASMAVGLALAGNASREPDVVLRRADADRSTSFLMPHEVILAVEVVSPGTKRTDRLMKPAEYAAAEIPCYWRIEQDPVHLYAYRLGGRRGPTGYREYELVTESAELIGLEQPFPIKLPIAEITP